MGEDTRADGAAVSPGARDPEQIRREIEDTRAELGDTVAAFAHKTDVKAQAKQRLDHAKASVAGRKRDIAEKTRSASPQAATTAASTASSRIRENPLPVALTGAFAVGFIAGRISGR
jgi:ElaB/YqjD/DUF883 family membrane-anchored ribosome-binding protein